MRLCVKKDTSVLKRAQREVPGVGVITYVLYEEKGLRNEPTEYGIEIDKRSPNGGESRRISSITADRFFASRLFRALILGEVTPCTLEDVVLDFLSEV